VVRAPEINQCRLQSDVPELMRAWDGRSAAPTWRFSTKDDASKRRALYLFSLLPDGVIAPFWDITGAQFIIGDLIDASGNKTRYKQQRFVPMMPEMTSVVSAGAQLSPGQESSCELTMAVVLPEARPLQVSLFSTPGELAPRIGGFFSEAMESAGASDELCWAIFPYQIVP
jgi:hypothetical protein